VSSSSSASAAVSTIKKEKEKEKKKDKTIEETYRQLTPEEHIQARSDTYVGSLEHKEEKLWVWDAKQQKMVFKSVTYSPALLKIFDEILVNADDHFHKENDPRMTTLKVDISAKTGEITVWNDGQGIPIVIHKDAKVYLPEFIFGLLRTGTNFDDKEKRMTGGRNGFGAKLCNLFSTRFTVETCDGQQIFKQTWHDRMTRSDKAEVSPCKAKEKKQFTRITFQPSFKVFNQPKGLDDDIVSLMNKRVVDIAGTSFKLKVFLNQNLLEVKNFVQYMDLYHPEKEEGKVPKVYRSINEHWQVGLTLSNSGDKFQQVSFVNSCHTVYGGTHVDHVLSPIVDELTTLLQKKTKKTTGISAALIRQKLFLFVNARVVNPEFDTQTKTRLTTSKKQHTSVCVMDSKLVKKIIKDLGLVDLLLTSLLAKDELKLKKTDGGKKKAPYHHDKLVEASAAGGKESDKCTLILTEGDSAKALAVAGLSVIGHKYYGVFPLRGKFINVREASFKKLQDNKEYVAIKKIVGLKTGVDYTEEKALKSLNYGSIMIMTDQDSDGSHIKGLIIDMFSACWPSLLKRPKFLVEFITPVVKVWRGKQSKISFYTEREYKIWKAQTNEGKGWSFKFYKGLGTSTAAEAKEYFSDLDTHVIPFKYTGEQDFKKLEMAFSKQQTDQRKKWLEQCSLEKEYVDHAKLNEEGLSYSEFVDKELALHHIYACERAIPSMIDGLKPVQRKVLFSCFKRNLVKEIKVGSLAGYVIENAAYHHGEASLVGTIVGMAQNYVGCSNNINLLTPSGQFGTREENGDNAASARYINTKLEAVTQAIFLEHDHAILEHLVEDGMKIEPKHYFPVVPMVLINGANGIGTGWSTNIPSYNPQDIVDNLRLLLDADEKHGTIQNVVLKPMYPWYRGWKGRIEPVFASTASSLAASLVSQYDGFHAFNLPGGRPLTGRPITIKKESEVSSSSSASAASTSIKKEDPISFKIQGVVKEVSPKTIEIQEIPIGKSLQDYKIFLKSLKTQYPSLVLNFDKSTSEQISFVLTAGDTKQMESIISSEHGVLKKLKLETTLSTSNMVLFNSQNKIKLYKNGVQEILLEFYNFRIAKYRLRKVAQLAQLAEELKWLNNRQRFVSMVVKEQLVIRNVKKSRVVQLLVTHKFDPILKKKSDVSSSSIPDNLEDKEEEEEEEEEKKQPQAAMDLKMLCQGYNYLMSMPLWNLTLEKVQELKTLADEKQREIAILEKKSAHALWRTDLDNFLHHVAEQEKHRVQELQDIPPQKKNSLKKRKNLESTSGPASKKRKS